MKALAAYNRDKVIDLLTERLEFERAGVKLYDSIIGKMERATQPNLTKLIGQMREHRDEEKEHEEWLEAQIRALGGDAHGNTEMSQLVHAESEGLEKVVLDGDPNVVHMFHALLTAELTDNSGWQLLIQLADEADDEVARREFKKRLHEEEDHLIFVRDVVTAFTRKQVFGGATTMAFRYL